ncbi:MAG: right-handed parallel beta-helix repeat-containing protein [Paludibacter sp.]|nr:right-handed parallel beta-helix repeat-containing protein [Paludibacter sp.]
MKNSKARFFYILAFLFSVGSLLAQTWSPDLPVSPNNFSEAEKEQQRINAKKLIDSLNTYVLNPDVEKTIIVNDHCRFSGSGSFVVSALKNTKIIGARGKNITFWFDAPHIYGLALLSCKDVSISNITFDCDPLPFTQGKVISKNAGSVLLSPMKGYETLISNANGIFVIFNPDGTFKRHGPLTCSMSQNTDQTISLTNGSFDKVDVGDYIVLPSRTGYMISLNQCENITLDSINIYASGGMVCLADKGKGNHLLRHVIATRRPGTNRLWMSGADGFHMNELAVGPRIEDCEISYTADDLINIHGRFGWVASRINNSKNKLRVIFTPGSVTVGQRIDFWDNNTQEYKGNAKVISMTSVTNQSDINEALTNAIPNLINSVYDIQLDANVDADFGSLMEYHTNVCSGYVIRNSKLHDTFNRGLLINGASDGLIEGNTVEHIGSGQSFHMETCCWSEGQYIRNLKIQNNIFRNAGGLWFDLVAPDGNNIYSAYRSVPMSNIQILNNTIELPAGDIYGITTAYIDTLRIEGNTIIRNMSDDDWSNSNLYFTDGYGISTESAVFTTTSRNVTIKDNVVTELTSNSAKKVDYGVLVNNISIDGEKQYNAVADVVTGWFKNGLQDDLGWSYGYANVTLGNYSKKAFVKMNLQSNNLWVPNDQTSSPFIGKMTAKPSALMCPVIRWTSTVSGELRGTGKVNNTSTGGDHVVILIYVDGVERYRYDTSNGNLLLDVNLGDVKEEDFVDFVVDSKGNSLWDQINFNFKYLVDENAVSSVSTEKADFPFIIGLKDEQLIVKTSRPTALLSVFSMEGLLLLSRRISDTTQYIPLKRGAYVVRLDEFATKIII